MVLSGVGQGHETAAGGASDNTLIRDWAGGAEDPGSEGWTHAARQELRQVMGVKRCKYRW